MFVRVVVCMYESMYACKYACMHVRSLTSSPCHNINKTDTAMLRRNDDYFVNDASDPDPCTKVRDAQLHTHAIHTHAHTRTKPHSRSGLMFELLCVATCCIVLQCVIVLFSSSE